MQKNNIKRHAVAAFRYYARHRLGDPQEDISTEDVIAIAAVASTLRHLHIEHKEITLDIVRLICFDLPPGDLPRGTITQKVTAAADELNTSYSFAWRELRRACRLFDCYYAAFVSEFR